MKKIGETAIENDWTFGFLHPFSISYYEKFGFANLNPAFEIEVPFEKLSFIARSNDVELYTGEQFEELCELYNKCAKKARVI